MKEIGMLFSTDIVRAIIDGRKTQTRRMIKKFPASGYKWAGWITDSTCKKEIGSAAIVPTEDDVWNHQRVIYAKPPVNVGDKIYVRETWQESYDKKTDSWEPVYFADNENRMWCDDGGMMKWKPSLHMPKKYARFWLKVTGISVQQIIKITEEEALAEGFIQDGCKARSRFFGYMVNKYGDKDKDGNEFLDSWCWVITFAPVVQL